MIHPTAVLDPAAVLGADVRIGPFATIEGPAQIGDGCILEAHASIVGDVRMGRNNRVCHGAVIGGWPQDLSYRPETPSRVEIGDDNVIREHCTIHRGTQADSKTRVGNRNFLMAGAHLGHNVVVGDDCVLANNVLLGGHAEVGNRAFLGGGSVFHQHTRVGRGAIAQGLSGFSKDIPPFTMAVKRNLVSGLNVIGLRRGGFSAEERHEIKRAFALLYASGLNVSQAQETAASQQWVSAAAREFWQFVAEAKGRGVCALIEKVRGEDV